MAKSSPFALIVVAAGGAVVGFLVAQSLPSETFASDPVSASETASKAQRLAH